MKKRLLIPLVVFLVIAGVGTAVTYWPRTVPWDECSELYRRYAVCPDVSAAYIKDYRVNDSLTLSATILQAVTDTGWAMLRKDFNLPFIPKEYESLFIQDSNQVTLMLVPKTDTLGMADSTSSHDIIAITYLRHTICQITLDDDSQVDAIVRDKLYNNNVLSK